MRDHCSNSRRIDNKYTSFRRKTYLYQKLHGGEGEGLNEKSIHAPSSTKKLERDERHRVIREMVEKIRLQTYQ